MRSRISLCIALVALYGMATRAPSSAQQAVPSDSVDILRRARNAQRDFESIRRANLPTELGGGGHSCDERIGRYCYWYDPSDGPAPRESDAVRRARERLLRNLATARGRLPGDEWITGQMVRYLIEHEQADSAIAMTLRCQETGWWCAALEGFARHMAHDYEGADDAFERALQLMPEAQRCAWIDLTPLLGDDNRRYRGLSCAERESVGERIWWLARPLYSRSGNDLRTEHYARHTMALLLEEAEPTNGVRWDDDTRELVLRFGWPRYWSRPFDRIGRPEPLPIIGHEPSPSFYLLPTPALTEPWVDLTELSWDPGVDRPSARYAPPYARGFGPIGPVQFARFRRHDTTLTVAAFDLTSDTILDTHPVDVWLAVAQDPATPPVAGQASPARPRGVVTVRSLWRPAVLSLEAMGVDTPWVARRRTMTPPDPGGLPPILSDILLFAPAEVLPASLDAVLPQALSVPVVVRSQRVGLYWEIYDQPDSTAPREIVVTVAKARSRDDTPYPVGTPWCPRPVASMRLRWREEPDTRPRDAARAVVLDLRSLSRGNYVVTIQVIVADRPYGCSSRELRVTAE